MSETTTKALIIAVALLIAIGLVIYFLRGKIKNAEVKGYGVTAKVGTHEPDRLVIKGIEQNAAEGSNKASIHSDNATVDGIKQTAKKDNDLVIGNPER